MAQNKFAQYLLAAGGVAFVGTLAVQGVQGVIRGIENAAIDRVTPAIVEEAKAAEPAAKVKAEPKVVKCYDPEKGLPPTLPSDTPYCEGSLDKLNAKLKKEKEESEAKIAAWGERVLEAKQQKREYCWNYYDQNGIEDYAAGCGM